MRETNEPTYKHSSTYVFPISSTEKLQEQLHKSFLIFFACLQGKVSKNSQFAQV